MATKLKYFHATMVVVWILLAVPTVLWWKQSILWVAGMMIYNIIIDHFQGYGAARTEEKRQHA